MMAGGSINANQNYYLYNESIETAYYTMTNARINNEIVYPFIVETDGSLNYSTNGTLVRGVRPVINIIKTAKVTGSGTVEDPYTIIMS